jgi:sugar/nucleoside kinase (ribokinase family)
MEELGLSTRYVHRTTEAATGVASVALDSTGQPSFVFRHPAAYDLVRLTDAEAQELLSHRPD